VFASATSNEVYFIHNNPEYFGYNKFLKEDHFHLSLKTKLKQDDQTPSDAIRVAAVMMHPDNKGAEQVLFSGARTERIMSDQSVPPIQACAMDAVKMFKDPSFKVPKPYDIDGTSGGYQSER
jgi:hypothetical protein